ncbi:MAG: 1-deoxy-D-xylulose-5-phosphate synthase [Candidatus Latescibacteria bacterium]|nr:1-deoxy-D-xylulose-5-phosphate synthase [Candidatus Latescibacterota bacterium]NIM21516.1 1-deoxy-D-xylulose-5-phosphate synthase [Candidatus Latescibacterota bacterium]NIM65687.1 1-deoxy-D-xylulose-5-phosphate synthase [Candidatus Latescibacterota bacterium]NIO02069.1 1-deoxy-D-xylulose-5-phosphate synthase [Candidatus Latescibacterota bacterium]NIO28881.1 1-deoxy-D-xylulose-5-phosphate synthase [Candidatus Latescibacterota bacterium]
MSKLLERINSPADLKKIPEKKLPQVAQEMREEIIRVVSKTGGHLGASLGAVELTLAIHYVFDAPKDRIVWDVGHQAYGHKLLTGRREQFETLRRKDGISGFPKRDESIYDTFGVGHASTAISAALGMAAARDIAGEDHKIIAVIGDGAFTGGIAFEGINNAGILKKNMLIILNDNKMSISRNVGAMSKYLTMITSGKIYNRIEADVWELLGLIPKVGGKARKLARRIKESIKNLIVPGIIFEELGFRYFGPVDGHNVEFLVETLKDIKNLNGPILLHVLTQKGKGVEFAEKDALCCHGVSSFDKVPGDKPSKKKAPAYTEVFGKTILDIASRDASVIAITAAMPDNTGLQAFADIYPDRFFDVGIAEQHAVTFAGGLAVEGLKPVVAIYSTFLQRAFDQIVHDIALQNLPVRFVLDRGGLVGEDGPTHHGAFDLSYLGLVPKLVIMSPKDENELQHMVSTLIDYSNGPIAMRFPRGSGIGVPLDSKPKILPIGKGEVLSEGKDAVFVAVGSSVAVCEQAAGLLGTKGFSAGVVNARFIKPLDTELLDEVLQCEPALITVEENSLIGGFGSSVLQHLVHHGFDTSRLRSIGIPDRFIEHGTVGELWQDIGLTADSVAKSTLELVQARKQFYGPLAG